MKALTARVPGKTFSLCRKGLKKPHGREHYDRFVSHAINVLPNPRSWSSQKWESAATRAGVVLPPTSKCPCWATRLNRNDTERYRCLSQT
jgi:hypothetical protein